MEKSFKTLLLTSVALGCLQMGVLAMDRERDISRKSVNMKSSPSQVPLAKALNDKSFNTKSSRPQAQQDEKLLEDFQKLESGINAIDDMISKKSMKKGIIFLGETGSGKSTLFNYLNGISLCARREDGVLANVIGPMAGVTVLSPIDHTVNSRTTLPVTYKNYYDLAGFQSTTGDVQDILNAYSIHQLLTKIEKLKIVLVVHEGDLNKKGGCRLVISKLAEMFPSIDNNILQGLSLVVTKRRDCHSKELFQKTFKSQWENLPQEEKQLTSNERAIIDFFTDAKNSKRIAFFDYPQTTSSRRLSADNKKEIESAINGVQYCDLRNLNPKISLMESESLLIDHWHNKIVSNVNNIFKKGVSGYCADFINNSIKQESTAEDFRKNFKSIYNNLESVNDENYFLKLLNRLSPESAKQFSNSLGRIEFLKKIDLKKIEQNPISKHLPKIAETKRLIENLSIEPKLDDHLTFTGHIIGASDVKKLMLKNSKLMNCFNEYSLRLMGHSVDLNLLKDPIKPGELGLFYEGENMFCKIFNEKRITKEEVIQIIKAEEGAASHSLPKESFNRLLKSLKHPRNTNGRDKITSSDMKNLLTYLSLHRDIKIESAHSYLFDDDLKMPGTTITLNADNWFVIGQRRIDLKGSNGKNNNQKKASDGIDYKRNGEGNDGFAGLHGLPGENGGTFIGTGSNYYNLHNLTIDVSGGNAGNGQDGGNGATGKKNLPGNLQDVEARKSTCLVSRKLKSSDDWVQQTAQWLFTLANTTYEEVYSSGVAGTAGGKGGEGGKAGISGVYGSVDINPPIPTMTIKKNSGKPSGHGKKGKDGIDGNRDENGNSIPPTVFEGTYIAEYILPEVFYDLKEINLERNTMRNTGMQAAVGVAEIGAGAGVGVGAAAGGSKGMAFLATAGAGAAPVTIGAAVGAGAIIITKGLGAVISSSVNSYWKTRPHNPYENNQFEHRSDEFELRALSQKK